MLLRGEGARFHHDRFTETSRWPDGCSWARIHCCGRLTDSVGIPGCGRFPASGRPRRRRRPRGGVRRRSGSATLLGSGERRLHIEVVALRVRSFIGERRCGSDFGIKDGRQQRQCGVTSQETGNRHGVGPVPCAFGTQPTPGGRLPSKRSVRAQETRRSVCRPCVRRAREGGTPLPTRSRPTTTYSPAASFGWRPGPCSVLLLVVHHHVSATKRDRVDTTAARLRVDPRGAEQAERDSSAAASRVS